jgi:hypothetical protein
MWMQSGLGQPAAGARRVGIDRRHGGIGALLLGLAVSACVNSGQLADLTGTRQITIALESIDGPPAAVFHKFVKNLKDEAGARQIAVVPASEANYRLRGYLAAHGQGATSITWALDVYDADQRRVFRLRGEEKAAGRAWAAADDQVLKRIARTGMQQFSVLAATRPGSTPVVAAASPPPPQRTSSTFGWLDDWAPEASGIFRILRGEPAKPGITADAGPLLSPDEVPLPRGRPAPSDAATGSAFAFAPEDLVTKQ